MIERVITGGQTGADQAGWRAARAAGIPTGGWMSLGFMTEDGPRPEFAGLYGAREMPTADYGARTDANVRDAEWVVWFGDQFTPGGRRTYRACERTGAGWIGIFWDPKGRDKDSLMPWNIAYTLRRQAGRGATGDCTAPMPWNIAYTLRRQECRVLMVAGNRESKTPGIGDWVERYMAKVFRLLQLTETDLRKILETESAE